MRKFFVKSENVEEESIKIVGTDVNHIKNVLRLKPGSQIEVCNQETQENFVCEITEMSKDCIDRKSVV